MHNDYISPVAAAEAYEQEQQQKELQKKEKEFDRGISLATLKELQKQNAQIIKEYNESRIDLKKANRRNLVMLIIAIVAAIAAVVSAIVAILK